MLNIIKLAKNSLKKLIFGNVKEKKLKYFNSIVNIINELADKYKNLTNEELCAQTNILKDRLKKGETLDDILADSFAVVREVSSRILNLRHYDVQLIGGIALHHGIIAEMRTGEGKTLVATLAAYLNSLTGEGVHVVTTNDYLAARDVAWVGKIYEFLGLTVGCITNDIMDDEERKKAYECDILYITNNELGFDYLRDNRKYNLESLVQRKLNYAIIDEVDSILIDEARTPLIISGPAEESADLYRIINNLIYSLKDNEFEVDYKTKNATLTEEGSDSIENMLKMHKIIEENTNLYDIENINLVHHVNQALKAHKIYKKDVDYLVKDDQVMIVDEFTGRVLAGRRYSEGLHQAIEAKEKVSVQNENKTLASITFQNYFRLYPKLAGMTGTAATEETEFREIYNLALLTIPTNKPAKVTNADDEIYATIEEKYQAIIEEVKSCNAKGQPILIGTSSIEKSEEFSKELKKINIEHKVLSAKYHQEEAYIIAQAGRWKAVTIATNMAGRGTDILLGGNPVMLLEQALMNNNYSDDEIKKMRDKFLYESEENKRKVIEAGGLYVIGTERHESRRIDNQLRGRAGRQGDPGKTKFYLSLEDHLMIMLTNNKTKIISSMLKNASSKKGEPIQHSLVSKAVERAQARVEAHYYETRKFVLQYDDVVNEQRQIIYGQRLEALNSNSMHEMSMEMIYSLIDEMISYYSEASDNLEEISQTLHTRIMQIFGLDLPIKHWIDEFSSEEITISSAEYLKDKIRVLATKFLEEKFSNFREEEINSIERHIFLLSIDTLWEENIQLLENLRRGINYRAYGQKNPLIEYRAEAFYLFEKLLNLLKEKYIMRIFRTEITEKNRIDNYIMQSRSQRQSDNSGLKPKIGRNEVCFCDSGKKYKHCHGKLSFS